MHSSLSLQKFLAATATPIFLLAITVPAFPQHAASSPSEGVEWNEGWKDLFDGKSTAGWRRYRSQEPMQGWEVIDGSLVRTQDGAGDIVTTDQYDNFELEFDYKISPGGNSGVMFHVTEDEPQPWMTGPEIQILDNVHGKDAQKAGWLYGLYKPTKPKWVARAEKQAKIPTPAIADATKPAGNWNHVYLKITPNQGELLLNGVRYYRFNKGGDDWKKRVRQSKFAKYGAFGISPKGHICLQDHGNRVAFRNIRIRPLTDGGNLTGKSPEALNLKTTPAFPKLKFRADPLKPDEGKVETIRPVALEETPAGYLLVAIQQGKIIAFANSHNAEHVIELLDLRDRVADYRKGNEEGLLGMALHPNFKTKREIFIYYTASNPPRRSVISRLSLNKNFFHSADRSFTEEVLLEVNQPFANHNGGSIAFGPDGFLYIGLGDGGSQNDPLGNGQNLNSLLGSILRIDVNQRDSKKPYRIPSDNPFLNSEGTRGEIFAFGFRNVWQLSFDKKTGGLWVADVGQDRYEEINLIHRGGNYGWSLMEGTKSFGGGVNEQTTEDVLIDPVWQYDRHHGRSITGGFVYRGQKLPALQGHYIYADYVSGTLWALNTSSLPLVLPPRRITDSKLPVIAFADDTIGSAFILTEGPPNSAFHRIIKKNP